MSLCPWGHQQTGTLRLECPRAQGGCFILACSTPRSPKSREWVQASHSEPHSCREAGPEKAAASSTEKPGASWCCWLLDAPTAWAS